MALKDGDLVMLDKARWPYGHNSWYDDLWVYREERGQGVPSRAMTLLERPNDSSYWITAPESALDRASALLLLARQAE
jgi:hypothetical protein